MTTATQTPEQPATAKTDPVVSAAITNDEKFWINRANPPEQIYWRRKWLGFDVSFRWRSRKCAWGRFGGGWQWKLGFQAGKHTIIVSLLICEIYVSR